MIATNSLCILTFFYIFVLRIYFSDLRDSKELALNIERLSKSASEFYSLNIALMH